MAKRNWCFTLNFCPILQYQEYEIWTEELFWTSLRTPRGKKECFKFVAFQHELAPTTGQSHMQGFLQLKEKMTMAALKKCLGWPDVHLEPMEGTPEQNVGYCTTEEYNGKKKLVASGPWMFGEMVAQGDRTDLQAAVQVIRRGGDLREVAEQFPSTFVRNFRGLGEFYRILRDVERPRFAPPGQVFEVRVFWGRTGSGKTHRARTEAYTMGETFEVTLAGRGEKQWFDGYIGQERVIVDEFNGQWPIEKMLQMLQWGPYRWEVKGATFNLRAWKWWITSNIEPAGWYQPRIRLENGRFSGSAEPAQIDALMRRLSFVEEMNEPYFPPAAAAPPASDDDGFAAIDSEEMGEATQVVHSDPDSEIVLD